jgi:hypothetical protein
MVRQSALGSLGDIADIGTEGAVERLLKDADPRVQDAAASALEHIRDKPYELVISVLSELVTAIPKDKTFPMLRLLFKRRWDGGYVYWLWATEVGVTFASTKADTLLRRLLAERDIEIGECDFVTDRDGLRYCCWPLLRF